MAKLSLQVAEISDAVGLVPVSKRQRVERAIAHVVGQGLDRFMECCRVFETKLATGLTYFVLSTRLRQAEHHTCTAASRLPRMRPSKCQKRPQL